MTDFQIFILGPWLLLLVLGLTLSAIASTVTVYDRWSIRRALKREG